MRFVKADHPPDVVNSQRRSQRDVCYLVNDNWDDFSFKTLFSAVYVDRLGTHHELGQLKIMVRAMRHGRVKVPNRFNTLDESFCSLGGDRDYYVNLLKLEYQTRVDYLEAVRDCVYDPSIWEAFREERAMQVSLLRTVSTRDVESTFRRILSGDSELSAYEFTYEFDAGDGEREICDFRVLPRSKPPTNIHVLIGRNGVGKTRLLAGMADALTKNKATTIGLPGRFKFVPITDEPNEFLNLVVVSYSAFDRFDPITLKGERTKASIPYYYIGIKSRFIDKSTDPHARRLKSIDEFNEDFDASMEAIEGDSSKRERWRRALRTLRSDPGIEDIYVSPDDETWYHPRRLKTEFANSSSGHKIVLLTMAWLVNYVSDRTLVLMDEPETHLHPPLLGSYIRAISELLIARNAVAIVATHSPVVLQEVPAHCVSLIARSGQRMRILRPDVETFAESVGTLTRKAFGLEVENSGFYRMLKAAANGRAFEEVLKEFDGQIGTEGRALARVFTNEDGQE